MKKIEISNKLVGDEQPIFIVAEIGVNHNGDVKLAKKLIDVARDAGADAVKFQAFKTERVVTKYAEKANYQKETTGLDESQYRMIRRLELEDKEFKKLFNYAEKNSIIFLSSAFDNESVDLLDDLGVPAFKVASGEIIDLPLLKYIAEKKRPIILSTGMSTLNEIGDALEVIREKGVEDVILLHCVTSYPAKIEDANLRVMETLRHKFKLPVGFSDHTLGITVPISAAALGAVLIEKHFTLDRTLPGPDHRSSLEPDELEDMIRSIRDVEKALGDGTKKPTDDEERIKKVIRRSIVAKVTIPRGTIITEDMLDLKRPGVGIEPKNLNQVVGRRAKKNVKPDELITFDKLV